MVDKLEKNEVERVDNDISNKIYEIRGKLVMLDSDLAFIYKCKNGTKVINQAVNRNLDRFPSDFYFQLTEDEFKNLKSQIVTSSSNNYGGIRKLSYVFTEEGVAMIATIIRTPVAAQVSINIMRAFVIMKKFLSKNILEQQHYKNMVLDHDNRIMLLENTFNKLEEKKKVNSIFFAGQIFDVYSLMMDIFNKAKKEIIIIDNFTGKELLDILKSIDKNIIIVSKNIDNTLVKKYNKQYSNVKFIINNTFHDRFIILDKSILYHSGSSMKDLGNSCFAINLIEDKTILDGILNEINRK